MQNQNLSPYILSFLSLKSAINASNLYKIQNFYHTFITKILFNYIFPIFIDKSFSSYNNINCENLLGIIFFTMQYKI